MGKNGNKDSEVQVVAVVLHGILAKTFNKRYELSITSPREAVLALSSLLPDFKKEFIKYDYEVYVSKSRHKEYINKDTIDSLIVGDELHFVPSIKGSKNNTQRGVGKILMAAALFFVVGPMVGAAGTTVDGMTAATVDAVHTINVTAAMMAISGISLMLTPDVKAPKDDSSKLSSGVENANNIAVPIVYGTYYASVIPVSSLISNTRSALTNLYLKEAVWNGE